MKQTDHLSRQSSFETVAVMIAVMIGRIRTAYLVNSFTSSFIRGVIVQCLSSTPFPSSEICMMANAVVTTAITQMKLCARTEY